MLLPGPLNVNITRSCVALPLYFALTGYLTGVLEDAKVYSEHAQKKELDVADVKLAIQNKMDHSFTSPPPRDVSYVCMLVC